MSYRDNELVARITAQQESIDQERIEELVQARDQEAIELERALTTERQIKETAREIRDLLVEGYERSKQSRLRRFIGRTLLDQPEFVPEYGCIDPYSIFAEEFIRSPLVITNREIGGIQEVDIGWQVEISAHTSNRSDNIFKYALVQLMRTAQTSDHEHTERTLLYTIFPYDTFPDGSPNSNTITFHNADRERLSELNRKDDDHEQELSEDEKHEKEELLRRMHIKADERDAERKHPEDYLNEDDLKKYQDYKYRYNSKYSEICNKIKDDHSSEFLSLLVTDSKVRQMLPPELKAPPWLWAKSNVPGFEAAKQKADEENSRQEEVRAAIKREEEQGQYLEILGILQFIRDSLN